MKEKSGYRGYKLENSDDLIISQTGCLWVTGLHCSFLIAHISLVKAITKC